ncbi:hypothetical protein M1413_02560 [Patescibacteria group bacterium]|jgi:hypothetical protein|nr:hypothetical protein [Patescibacteria group bacterium]MCL5114706.1 hypothetical protein [Patescibacteria group bacterium]
MSAEVVANKLVLDEGSKKIVEQMLDEAYGAGDQRANFFFNSMIELIKPREECLEEIMKKYCECK